MSSAAQGTDAGGFSAVAIQTFANVDVVRRAWPDADLPKK
jgi:hypothetical protein